jgi:hypothetical protein
MIIIIKCNTLTSVSHHIKSKSRIRPHDRQRTTAVHKPFASCNIIVGLSANVTVTLIKRTASLSQRDVGSVDSVHISKFAHVI